MFPACSKSRRNSLGRLALVVFLCSYQLVDDVQSFKIFGFDLNNLRAAPRKPTYIPRPTNRLPPPPPQQHHQESYPDWNTRSSERQTQDYAPPPPRIREPQLAYRLRSQQPTEQPSLQAPTAYPKLEPVYSQESIQEYSDYQEIEIITAPSTDSRGSVYGGQHSFEVKVGAGFHTKTT